MLSTLKTHEKFCMHKQVLEKIEEILWKEKWVK